MSTSIQRHQQRRSMAQNQRSTGVMRGRRPLCTKTASLLTESEILQNQVSAGPNECSDNTQQQGTDHERPTVYAVVSKTAILFR